MQIEPIIKDKPSIPIVFAFNDEYCKYFAVALQSLIDNSNKSYFYDIVVFTSGISNRNQFLLKQMLPVNFSMRFFNISDYIVTLFKHEGLKEYKYWSVEMYYRIVIPIIMKDYNKVLYLDSDTLCRKDIIDLFNIDFERKEIIAVLDAFNLVSELDECQETRQYLEKILGSENLRTYFNSGILLFNNKEINTNNYLNDIKKALKIEKTNCPDQDVLNLVFAKKAKLINLNWNLQYHIPILYEKHIHKFNKSNMSTYKKAYKDPFIIHFTSPIKPWFCPDVELADVFWKYARETVYYEEIIHSMCRNEITNSRFATSLYLKLQTDEKIILWGASLFLEDFIKRYDITQENILGVIDIDSSRYTNKIGSYPIYPPDILKSKNIDKIIVTIVNYREKRFESIKSFLEDNNLAHIKLIRL